MKRSLLFAFFFGWVSLVFAQYYRRVLIEEFTGAVCSTCAFQDAGFNAKLEANADLVTAIKYHVGWSNLGFDPMNAQNPSEVEARDDYYGLSDVPHGLINGTSIADDCNYYEGSPACLSDADIMAAYTQLTPVTMSVSHSLSSNYDSIYVQISLTSDDILTGMLRLRVAVLEEEIYLDHPYYSLNPEFFQVMRKMLPNAGGTATGDFAAGETKTYSFAWKIGYAYDLNQIGAVAWLQDDDTKEVLQSGRSLPAGDIPAAGVSVVSHNTFACSPGYQPVFTIKNTGANALTEVNLQWRVGISAWKDYTWTGNLAPGASSQITLDTAFPATGTYKVSVELLNSNNGTQTNLIDAISTFQIRVLTNAPAALPFLHGFQTDAVPPPGWTVNNFAWGNEVNGWKLATTAGAGSTRSVLCNFYDFNAAGIAMLTTPKIDLSQATGVTTLRFDHAYTYYVFSSTLFDSLRIQVSNDCGNSWKTIFHDGKDGLATATPENSFWIPTADDWANNSIDISEFNGSPELLVRFIGESDRGNNLYLDNINVSSLVGVKELHLSTFSLHPNPTFDVAQVRFGLDKAENILLFVYSNQGDRVESHNIGVLPPGEHSVTLEAGSLHAGSYRVVLQGEEDEVTAQWVIIK
ncbi:MAG: hypothetical protein EPGJADBJ_00336 [Saprospiraceae bacterium]|nr:hypothetical protein [Saprospiraceae bacterium]